MLKKLILIGSYPPPLGGVSLHIFRLTKYLLDNNIQFKVLNHGRVKGENVEPNNKSIIWYFRLLFRKNKNLVHFHQAFYGIEFLYWYLFSKINSDKIFITIHNDQIIHKVLKRKISLFLLKKTKYLELIVVSDKVNRLLIEHNIRNIYLPAYVPIQNSRNHFQTASKKKKIVFAIFRITKENLIHIYGFDFVMELLNRVISKYELLVLVGDKKKSDLEYLNRIIQKYGHSKNVRIIFEKQLTDILPTVDILVRPNRKDGYGISLQEALEAGVIPLASDVCTRPSGTILFKSNDFNDFFRKFNFISSMNENERKGQLNKKENLDYHLTLINMYKKYLVQ